MQGMSRGGGASGRRRRTPASTGAWPVLYHPKARAEADAVPAHERKAIDNAVDELAALGPEAQHDRAGFENAVRRAKRRLAEVEP